MDLSMAWAAVLGLGPALILMYAVLRKYTYPAVEQPFFSDPTLFGLFAVGLVAGTIMFVGYTYFYGSWGNIFVAIGFALIYELVKLVVLNLRRFHGKSDTIFYGFGLGLGIGSTLAFGVIFYLASQIEMDTLSWVIVITMGLTQVFLHAGTGTTIGEGVARKRTWEFLLQALLVDMAVQLLAMSIFTSLAAGSVWYYVSYVAFFAALAVAILYFLRVNYVKLPGIVRDVLRMEGKKRNDIPRL